MSAALLQHFGSCFFGQNKSAVLTKDSRFAQACNSARHITGISNLLKVATTCAIVSSISFLCLGHEVVFFFPSTDVRLVRMEAGLFCTDLRTKTFCYSFHTRYATSGHDDGRANL